MSKSRKVEARTRVPVHQFSDHIISRIFDPEVMYSLSICLCPEKKLELVSQCSEPDVGVTLRPLIDCDRDWKRQRVTEERSKGMARLKG
jgi:hypothetical protein